MISNPNPAQKLSKASQLIDIIGLASLFPISCPPFPFWALVKFRLQAIALPINPRLSIDRMLLFRCPPSRVRLSNP